MNATRSPLRNKREMVILAAFVLFLGSFTTTVGVLLMSGWWKLAVLLVVSYVAYIVAEVW